MTITRAEYMRDEEVFLSQILISTEGKTPEQVATARRARERPGGARPQRARNSAIWRATTPTTWRPPKTADTSAPPSKRGTLRPELEAIVFNEKKGFITDPIKLTNPPGFLILKVEEHYQAGQASFEEVRDEVQNAVVGPLMEPKVREYLTQLRQEAYPADQGRLRG